MARQILYSYPDYGKAPPEFLMTVTEFMAGLSNTERMVLMDMRTGIRAREKFLPTIADMMKLLTEYREKREQFQSTRRASEPVFRDNGDRLSEEELDRRKQIVYEQLGYDPARFTHQHKRAFKTKPIDQFKSSADCKTPAAAPSNALIRHLHQTGWPYLTVDAIERVGPDRRDPEKFFEECDEIAWELTKIATEYDRGSIVNYGPAQKP